MNVGWCLYQIFARSGTRMTESRSDAYGYNDRTELTNAVKNATLNEYAYQYDDIGNRLSSLDLGTNRTYTANSLNQYTNIVEGAGGFLPQFDDDGNQTLIKTATGVWQVAYNGENRPVLWECGSTNITMKFDRMGRRVEYIETVSGETNTHHRFVYDGYLCIQRLNALSNNAIDLVFGWDPSEQVATRPLILQKYGQYNLFYTHDGNKNVSELVFFQQANGIAAHYEYAPFGAVTAAGRSTPVTAYDFREYNPFRFSSEYADLVAGLMYYNYRCYHPQYGRWFNRDPLTEYANSAIDYVFAKNSSPNIIDVQGQYASNLPGVLQWSYCEDAYRKAREHLNTPQEKAAWDRYTNHGWRGRDRNIYLTSDEVKSIAMAINAVSEYIKNKREACNQGNDFEETTSIPGTAPAPWVLAIGGVSIGVDASCKEGCFSYCLSISDLYDFDIKGIPGFTSRSAKGEAVTWLVRITQGCLQCEWETFYHIGNYCGK